MESVKNSVEFSYPPTYRAETRDLVAVRSRRGCDSDPETYRAFVPVVEGLSTRRSCQQKLPFRKGTSREYRLERKFDKMANEDRETTLSSGKTNSKINAWPTRQGRRVATRNDEDLLKPDFSFVFAFHRSCDS